MKIHKFNPKQINLNLGCGVWLRKGYINVDNYFTLEDLKSKKGVFANAKLDKGAVFVKADIKNMPFKDNYADYVELFNTIEHFPHAHIVTYLKEIYRVMKKGTTLRIITNSFSGILVDWLKMVTDSNFDPARYNDLAEIIYGNQYGLSEGEVHRSPFTPIFMNYVLNQAGFKQGNMLVIYKGFNIPKFGNNVVLKEAVARNDLLLVETIK